MKKCLLLIVVVAMSSCNKKHDVGEYVYVSYTAPNGVIHIDRECENKTVMKPARELYKEKALPVSYNLNYDFCSKCITDEAMKQIEDSIAKYKNAE